MAHCPSSEIPPMQRLFITQKWRALNAFETRVYTVVPIGAGGLFLPSSFGRGREGTQLNHLMKWTYADFSGKST
jgi:hypothetical protein